MCNKMIKDLSEWICTKPQQINGKQTCACRLICNICAVEFITLLIIVNANTYLIWLAIKEYKTYLYTRDYDLRFRYSLNVNVAVNWLLFNDLINKNIVIYMQEFVLRQSFTQIFWVSRYISFILKIVKVVWKWISHPPCWTLYGWVQFNNEGGSYLFDVLICFVRSDLTAGSHSSLLTNLKRPDNIMDSIL